MAIKFYTSIRPFLQSYLEFLPTSILVKSTLKMKIINIFFTEVSWWAELLNS